MSYGESATTLWVEKCEGEERQELEFRSVQLGFFLFFFGLKCNCTSHPHVCIAVYDGPSLKRKGVCATMLYYYA